MNAHRLRYFYEFSVMAMVSSALRLNALGQEIRFHPDEAFFATFSRNAAVFGDWLLTGSLDKTPLSMYAGAISMHFVAAQLTSTGIIEISARAGEIAARLPAVFAGIVLTLLIGTLGRTLYGHRAGLMAMLLAAASPYAIVFSAAAFTDMLMLTLMTAALWLAVRHRWAASGLLFALAFASKQQAVFYLPLILAAGMILHGLTWRGFMRFTAGMGLVTTGLLLWDNIRPGTSVFALAAANNQPSHVLITPALWLDRLLTWIGYGGWLLGPPLITGALVLLALVCWPRQADRIGRLLWTFVITYGLLHVIMGFNTYDRYLLPLLPPLAVLAGQAMARFSLHRYWMRAAALAGLAAVLLTAYAASSARLALGRDHYPEDPDGEIMALADYLNAQPLGTIIYDHWLGWELEYYLGAWHDKRRVYYPQPQILAEDALLNPDPAPRFLVAPVHAELTPWLDALVAAGFDVSHAYQTAAYTAYVVIPP